MKTDNEIIAEFMCGQFNTDSENPNKWWFYPQPTTYYRKDAMHLTVGLKYDSDWNWLMPVVEKIGELGYQTTLHTDHEPSLNGHEFSNI